jgi:hypothetical protein
VRKFSFNEPETRSSASCETGHGQNVAQVRPDLRASRTGPASMTRCALVEVRARRGEAAMAAAVLVRCDPAHGLTGEVATMTADDAAATDRARNRRVLVSAASRHGATAEIVQAIGRALSAQGLTVTVIPPGVVRSWTAMTR